MEGVTREEEPSTAVARIADAAMTAAERQAMEEGAEVAHMVVMVHIKGEPDGEEDSSAGTYGVESTEEALRATLAYAKAMAASIGIEMQAMPLVLPEDRNFG